MSSRWPTGPDFARVAQAIGDTRKDARRCRAGPLLVRLFWHDRAGSSILPALSEHLGVEDVEV